MRRSHLKARLLRAISGKTQEEFSEAAGMHPSAMKPVELGREEPSPGQLRRMGEVVDLSELDTEEVLRRIEARQQMRRSRQEGIEPILQGLVARLEDHVSEAYRHLLALPGPELPPRAEDRRQAEEQWERMKEVPPETALKVVPLAEELQNWALCEVACEHSIREASRDVERSAALARLAQEIADRIGGPESWRNCIRGYATAHGANSLRVAGALKAADAAMEQAQRLWAAGADPSFLLDPGRVLDLEASLRRDQRRFDDALALLDEEVVIGRFPERALINKALTLEVMGEYGRAVEALLQAYPRIERQTEPRLWNILRLNLANNFCHLGRHSEAAELVTEVRPLVAELGDEIDLMRILWLEGRIAAGLGRRAEALRLFAEARHRFAAEEMSYDVALLLLEEAVLLLEADRTAEVKALAQHLTQVFEDQGVHREALAALQLFQKAAEREAATAELARRVLRYLYQARHDQGLRFNGF